MKAVVDRFEGDMAVVLLGSEEIKVDLPRHYLPGGVREGSILRLTWELDQAETDSVRQQMQERINRLKQSGPR